MGRSALAGRPDGCDRSWVDDAAVLAVLTEADSSPALPRLGGMARPNGVAIVSERIWCFSGTDGSTRPVAAMPQAPAPLHRVPLFRGIVKLVGALTRLVGRGSAAPLRGRILLAAALAAPLALPLLPGPYRSPALGVVTIALVASILRGRTLNLHG